MLEIETLCSRLHNNTAFLGVQPTFSKTVNNIDQCRDICLESYPYCVAVIFYKITTLKDPLCYLFNKSSIHQNVLLYPEKPLAENDIINIIEIVGNCHEFDAIPPLSDIFTTSSDKVSRIRRASNFNKPIKRNGLWSGWTKCSNGTTYQIRFQSCEYGRLIQKRQCSTKLSSKRSSSLYSSPFHPYPPEPYKHPDNKSPEYESRSVQHKKQMQQLRKNCCKRQNWYREHVGKNYITFCRHPCPPPDLLDIEQDPEELSHDKQQQYIFSEKPISQIQEFSKGQLDEIIMLPTPQQEFSTLAPEDYRHEEQVQPQPSESERDEFYRQQEQQESSTLSPEDYRHEEVQPQPSESEGDEYYRQQQQEFSTISPEDYRQEQQIYPPLYPQPSESELDEYDRQQEVKPQPSKYPSDDYYSQQQEQQKFPLGDYHGEQEAQPQPFVPLPDDRYRQQQQQQQQYIGETRQDEWATQYYPDRDLVHDVEGWNPWTTWSICPIVCGDSVQTRRRTCPTGNHCNGETIQERPCHFRPCGLWADWSDCSHCEGH
ncbi:thrombospondin type 1 domain-containing protein [Loa loa]|uniref:Thrombospondin type 1 domain-containing protein n=1 Tax=Loa loa TaxID=7209 RepID=A0A1S0UEG0_LOALO|nr:thrombospondin type 1 domain-containing protein [Loa loa]EJD73965.1 thrombospondin type 1 domain-containing protein [Loa loa]